MAAQDPDEPFDLCDRDGQALGRSKARARVHRDGDWHRALHLWVLLREGSSLRVVWQRRSLAKDTNPGLVDVSVAGHLRAGEGVAEALREADEEIGLRVELAATTPLGWRRVEKPLAGGFDREVQTLLATVSDVPFASLRPHPEEVAALYAGPLDEALALARGARDSVVVEALWPDGARTTATLARADMVPEAAGYHAPCLEALADLAAGRPVRQFAGS